ncbi:dipeptidyl peptidase 3-like [Paramuricea clavata]|nr:dipeptidyl peptidase 3-like [Paramuricea clavata]
MGNYKSFGDTKFIPGLAKERFKDAITCSVAYKKEKEIIENLCTSVLDDLYNLSNRRTQLGLEEQGLSTYYSSNCTRDDVVLVQDFMKEKEISPYNTRLFKVEKEGNVEYQLRLASVATTAEPLPGPDGQEDTVPSYLGEHVFKKNTIKVLRGDYSGILKEMVQHLTEAEKYAANSNQSAMLKDYIHCFNTGSIDAHKNGSRHWIRDKGPVIESYIGFIESYRDPFGVRGEFEGFVAMVNKEMSKKFANLVNTATDLLPLLPWPQEYEKDKFLRPDFTSLDILGFGSSGVPAGINIPNYDDIRQREGFKNVSLGNVLASHSSNEKVTFIAEEHQELYSKLKAPSFEVQVGLHELLGHGSGKLFQLNEDGTYNFNDKTLVPDTDTVVNSWYKPGETWDIIFQEIASTYEECRAECVGLYLCLNNKVLSIFGHEGEEAKNISYINWLNMVRAGLIALEFYTPENKKWRQAHMQARYVILQVLLEAGEGLVTIEKTEDEDSKGNILIKLDKEKIQTVGRDAIGMFLKRLQIYKSTADYEQGKTMYDGYSSVDEKFLELRKLVLAKKQPRRMLVQANTNIQGDDVILCEYAASAAGMITSFSERYPSHDAVLEKLWRDEAIYHQYK